MRRRSGRREGRRDLENRKEEGEGVVVPRLLGKSSFSVTFFNVLGIPS